ncbi:hypothetical protein MTO96_036482 [Rhipicephalus appendiculatus]
MHEEFNHSLGVSARVRASSSPTLTRSERSYKSTQIATAFFPILRQQASRSAEDGFAGSMRASCSPRPDATSELSEAANKRGYREMREPLKRDRRARASDVEGARFPSRAFRGIPTVTLQRYRVSLAARTPETSVSNASPTPLSPMSLKLLVAPHIPRL